VIIITNRQFRNELTNTYLKHGFEPPKIYLLNEVLKKTTVIDPEIFFLGNWCDYIDNNLYEKNINYIGLIPEKNWKTYFYEIINLKKPHFDIYIYTIKSKRAFTLSFRNSISVKYNKERFLLLLDGIIRNCHFENYYINQNQNQNQNQNKLNFITFINIKILYYKSRLKRKLTSYFAKDYFWEIKTIPHYDLKDFSMDNVDCADPFAVLIDNDKYICFEYLDHNKGYAVLKMLKLSGGKKVSETTIDLKKHLSYPSLYYDESISPHIIIMPECTSFKTQFFIFFNIKTLEFNCVHTNLPPLGDPSLFNVNGNLHVLGSTDFSISLKEYNSEISLFKVKNFPYQWESGELLHIGFNTSRGGGSIFHKNNCIHRFIQVSDFGSYGDRIMKQKIDLKNKEISITEVDFVNTSNKKIHHFCEINDFIIWDAKNGDQ